jgi:hypothetical protein|eukprot:COSAG01_NODE_1115_length_11643_cov_197.836798_13_plen_48_part_00
MWCACMYVSPLKIINIINSTIITLCDTLVLGCHRVLIVRTCASHFVR